MIALCAEQTDGRTDGVTPWAPDCQKDKFNVSNSLKIFSKYDHNFFVFSVKIKKILYTMQNIITHNKTSFSSNFELTFIQNGWHNRQQQEKNTSPQGILKWHWNVFAIVAYCDIWGCANFLIYLILQISSWNEMCKLHFLDSYVPFCSDFSEQRNWVNGRSLSSQIINAFFIIFIKRRKLFLLLLGI